MSGLNERGLREGLGEMAAIRRTVVARVNDAHRRFGEAEAEFNAMTRLLGFVDQTIAQMREDLGKIEREKEQQ